MYRCVKELVLDMYDDDNDVIENKHMKVDKGSEWLIDDYEYKENDVRLTNEDAEWIEISRSTFKEHFERIITA